TAEFFFSKAGRTSTSTLAFSEDTVCPIDQQHVDPEGCWRCHVTDTFTERRAGAAFAAIVVWVFVGGACAGQFDATRFVGAYEQCGTAPRHGCTEVEIFPD